MDQRSFPDLSVVGAGAAGPGSDAIIYTALETARLNGIDPEAWLADFLQQLARGRSQLDLEALMPWNWRKPASLATAA